jgi:hypothetical protein
MAGAWDLAYAVLQPAAEIAQELADNPDGAEDPTVAEAVMFQLLVLQLQAVWHLRHDGNAAEIYAICEQFAMSSEASSDKESRLQHLFMVHILFVKQCLREECCSADQLRIGWRLLHQAKNLIRLGLELSSDEQWIYDAQHDVRCTTLVSHTWT